MRYFVIIKVERGAAYVSLVLRNDLYFGSNAAKGEFLVIGNLRGSPTVEPFCRVGSEVDAAVGTRTSEVVVPESAVKGDAAFCNILNPRDAGQIESAGGNIPSGHVA